MGLLDPEPTPRFSPDARFRGFHALRRDNFAELQALGHDGHESEQQRIDREREESRDDV